MRKPPAEKVLPVDPQDPALDPDSPFYRPRDEFSGALRRTRRLLWVAAGFSGAVNLLFLASPIYLIQIYNRVLPSGSMATLIGLSVALMLALLTMAVLDAARARILVRAAARIDRLLASRVFQATIDLSLKHGRRLGNAQMLRELDQFRSALAGQAAQFFFDVPWMPLFLIALFIIHPVLGVAGLAGALLLVGLAFLNDRATRDAQKRLNAAEREVSKLEEKLNTLSDELTRASIDGNVARVTELGQTYEALQQDLEAAYSRWNEATAELDALHVEVSGV